MKKMKLFLILIISLISCNTRTEKKSKPNAEQEVKTIYNEDLKNIELNGKSFYDWYFKNEFPNCDIIKDKNGKCLVDTLSYFNNLRNLGTISEKFINKEKKRLQGCFEFMANLDFSEYENSDAYEYDEYCGEIYFMYWIKSEERPNSFSTKSVTKTDENNSSVDIYVNYGGEDEPLSKVLLEKEQNIWKIVEIKFLNRDEKRPVKVNPFGRKWYGGIVALNIGETSLAFEYHGQCVYFYPVKKISDTEFEMIWAREMDCKFDNGTGETFGLKHVPVPGKPFSRFTLKNNILYVNYYYKEWVKKYSEKVQEDVFMPKYFWRNE